MTSYKDMYKFYQIWLPKKEAKKLADNYMKMQNKWYGEKCEQSKR